MNNELERMLREAVLVLFKVLSRHSLLGTEKNYGKKPFMTVYVTAEIRI
jgi:hypothetical protein